MATIESLRNLVRNRIRDTGRAFADQLFGDGEAVLFDLSVENVDRAGLTVTLNSDPPQSLIIDTDYTLYTDEGQMNFNAAPGEGISVTLAGRSYRWFTNESLDIYVQNIVNIHLFDRTDGVTLETFPPVEEQVLVLGAAVEAFEVLVTEFSTDIDIIGPDAVNIPRSQRFHQAVAMLQGLEAEYEKKSSLLNVGLEKLVMTTLRRVSLTTNRLVPLYMPREFDDHSATPQRLYPPIDDGIPTS